MKIKDLQVGKEYAFGAPNSYEATRPARVRVIRTGVYGPSPQGTFYRTRSKHANQVEFEAVGDSYVNTCQFEVPLNANGEIPGRYAKGEAADVVRRVLRGPARYFLKPWEDHAAEAKEAEAASREFEQRQIAEREHRNAVAERLRALGLYVSKYTDNIQLSVEDAEKLLEMIE